MGQQNKHDLRSSASIKREVVEDLHERYGASLKRYFARKGAATEDHDDLVQDVFLRLSARSKGAEIANHEAYLMTTASSVWIDHLRRSKQGNRVTVEYSDEEHTPEVTSTQKILEDRRAVSHVIQALNSLPEKTKTIYVLCRLEGLSRDQVARQYGVSKSAIDKHLMNASVVVKQAYCEFFEL